MSCYYIMMHWDGGAVNGFIVPEAESESQARKILLHRLISAKQMLVVRAQSSLDELGVLAQEMGQIKAFIKSLNKYWRKTKHWDDVYKIVRLSYPVESGYWLKELITQQTVCNLT